jgi:Cytochrome P450
MELSWEQMPRKAILSESKNRNYCTVGLLAWTSEVLLGSATRTFFGARLLGIEPELFQKFRYFNYNSWLFTYKIPKAWSKVTLAAKNVVQKALETYFDLPLVDRSSESWLIRTLEYEMRAIGIASKDIVAMLNMVFWVIKGNVYKSYFWILAQLLHNLALLSAIKREVADAIDAQTPANELPERLDTCKQQDEVFHEVLRLISSSMAVRNVATPMDVGGKTLRKGTKITIAFQQIHFNEAIWGVNAREFDPTRFPGPQGKEARAASRDPNFRHFGGGTTISPGRFMARREVLTFVRLALVRFDMSLHESSGESNDQGWRGRFPTLEQGKPCLDIMPSGQREEFVCKGDAYEVLRTYLLVTAFTTS